MNKLLLIIALFFLILHGTFATGTYQRARIFFNGKDPVQLARLGIDLTEGEFRKGVWFTSEFSKLEVERIRAAGFHVEILIDDLKLHYHQQQLLPQAINKNTIINGCGINSPNYNTPVHFGYGSMGGFYTYSEMLEVLDSMILLYPNLVSAKYPIDSTYTFENRLIHYVKISDNPNVQEPESRVLYTALHHAREPMGMSQMIFYMWYLLENYANNTEVQAIVNNTELYFVPCLNPDGYIYNEMTDPNGGGFWRKNRRNNFDGTFGVDLNRNYGYQWGFDDNGSSPDSFDETFRGNAAFSESETQAVKNFTDSMHFKLALNYHSYGNLLIYPWGYVPNFYTPDSARYTEFGELLTTYNNYNAGTAVQTVQYVVNGGSDDWMYGDQLTKPKIFAMTPEVGEQSQGFWPVQGDILPLCLGNVFSNLTLAHLAGAYAKCEDNSPGYISSQADFAYFNLTSIGLDSIATFTVSVIPISPNILFTGSPKNFINISSMSEIKDSISIQVSPAMNPGDIVEYILSVNNGLITISDTITRIFGLPSVVLSENGNSLANWSAGSQWGIDNAYFVSANSSISDSPFGPYNSNANNNLVLGNNINLTTAVAATVSFYARWEIEKDYDYAQLAASINNGSTWIPLCGKYTTSGSASQDFGEPLYDGFQNNWVKEEVSLNDFLGQNIKLRFRLISDGFAEYDGFYFDDLTISKINATGMIENQGLSSNFSIFPNPASDELKIYGDDIKTYEILTVTGQSLIKGNSISHPVSITEIPDGLYLFRVMSGNSSLHTLKFVKLKSIN